MRFGEVLQSRGLQPDADLEQIATLESQRRRLIPEIEGLKREQNNAADEVARVKREGGDPSPIFAANKARAGQTKQLEQQLEQIEQQRTALLMTLPNLPHASVPQGKSADDNVGSSPGRDAARVRLRAESALGPRACSSAFSISSGRPECPARGSPCCSAAAPGSRGR